MKNIIIAITRRIKEVFRKKTEEEKTTIIDTDRAYRLLRGQLGGSIRYGCFPGWDFIQDVDLLKVIKNGRAITMTVEAAATGIYFVDFEPVNDPALKDKPKAAIGLRFPDGKTFYIPAMGYSIHNKPEPE